MVRGRRKGNNRIKIGIVGIVVVSVAIVILFPSLIVGILPEPVFTGIEEIRNFFVVPQFYSFTLINGDQINCELSIEVERFNVDGTRELFSLREGIVLPTIISVTGLGTTSGKEIDWLKSTPRLFCADPTGKDHSIGMTGGSFTNLFSVTETGEIGLSPVKFESETVSSFFRSLDIINLDGSKGRLLNTASVLASEIEAFATIPTDVPSVNKLVLACVANGQIFISIDGQAHVLLLDSTAEFFGGVPCTGTFVKIINDNFIAPVDPVSAGTTVTAIGVTPSTIQYISDCNAVTNPFTQTCSGGDIRITFQGRLDKWGVQEGIPTFDVYDNINRLILNDIPMTTIVSKTNCETSPTLGELCDTQFKRSTLDLGVTITDATIANRDGAWRVVMQSFSNIRGVSDTSVFVLRDDSTVEEPPPPPPKCTSPQIPDQNGNCVTPTTPTDDEPDPTDPLDIVCPSLADMATFISSANNDDLESKKLYLEDLTKNGNTQLCVKQFLAFVNQEVLIRGIIITEPTPTGTSGVKAFLEYQIKHEPPEGSTQGCFIPSSGTVGRLPAEGIAITGFQLLGGNTCNTRFIATDIDVVLDFGADVKEFIKDNNQFDLEHKLFISVNNPYPTDPVFECLPNINPSLLPNCNIKNHNFLNDKVGDVGLRFDQVAEPNNFVDQTGGDPRLQLAHIVLQENLIKDAIQKDHILLQGDKVEVLYYTWGKFGGTFKGSPVTGAFQPLWMVQTFTWDDQGVQTKCPDGENLREDRTCKPIGTDVCEEPNKKDVNGNCRPPIKVNDPQGNCTSPQVPDGMGGCKAPDLNPDVICEASLVENIPMCNAETEDILPTGETDSCDIPFLECKPKGTAQPKPTPTPNGCTSPQISDGMGGCIDRPPDKIPLPPTGCPAMYVPDPDDATKCKLIGGNLGNGDPPKGGGGGVCNITEGFDFAQCFAQIISGLQQGFPTFTLGEGLDPIIFVVIAVIIIALVAVGIIIRRRRGAGGF